MGTEYTFIIYYTHKLSRFYYFTIVKRSYTWPPSRSEQPRALTRKCWVLKLLDCGRFYKRFISIFWAHEEFQIFHLTFDLWYNPRENSQRRLSPDREMPITALESDWWHDHQNAPLVKFYTSYSGRGWSILHQLPLISCFINAKASQGSSEPI